MSADDHDHGDHHHRSELSEMQLRVRALETILTQKGYVDPTALNVIIETYETKIGPHVGARVVACWLFVKTASIWPPTVAHVANNVLQSILLANNA